ncbi:dual specificity mitogen-activated protein kinase kinase 2-like [Bolinopsis microptera]|uniref:dual specificity mitogen-activated protein kinase kinase 2-like n=1 Tax=Bolinopsis microptera TaxID=2820187 RepID=UPI003078B917
MNLPRLAIKPIRPPVGLPQPVIRQPEPPSNIIGDKEAMQVNGVEYPCKVEDLIDEGEIGRGRFGSVHRMKHKPSGVEMAVKRMIVTVDDRERKTLQMDVTVIMKAECPYIVKFYGALFREGEVWICMERMDTSLDKFYRFVYQTISIKIPEDVLGKMVVSIVQALSYLKRELNIIHRDVKPSNILINSAGCIKMCDFGISGELVNSIAATREVGCKPYMAPERIDPAPGRDGFDVRSDVWSLGISVIELATGKFPFPPWNSVFDQLTSVVEGRPPSLPETGDFSDNFRDFVVKCLIKDVDARPKYRELLTHPFILESESRQVDVEGWASNVLGQAAAKNFKL